MKDPIDDLSDRALFTLSVDLRLQLEKNAGTRPMLFLIHRQREKAANAVHGLVNAPPDGHMQIREFQNEVKLYVDMVDACKELLSAGYDLESQFDDADRQDISDLMTPEQARMHGLNTQGSDT